MREGERTHREENEKRHRRCGEGLKGVKEANKFHEVRGNTSLKQNEHGDETPRLCFS